VFQSATVRLTAWYVAILAVICLAFSSTIYVVATRELNARLTHFDNGLQIIEGPTGLPLNYNQAEHLRGNETSLASSHLILELIYCNSAILILGGIGSYYLARRTMQPIERAHEAQSRFTSDASHELRTPLASMQIELESVLRDKEADSATLREVLQSSLEEVGKMSALSGMLLDLSQLEYKKLDMKPVDLITLTREAIEHTHRENRICLKAPKQLKIVANDTALGEAITILLDNALKYSTNKSTVDVRLSKSSRGTIIAVSNDGAGIKAEDLPHIFERFYRGDSSRTGGTKSGFGLGLSLAQKIVELHHGSLTAESKPGHLTTFRILLPATNAGKADKFFALKDGKITTK